MGGINVTRNIDVTFIITSGNEQTPTFYNSREMSGIIILKSVIGTQILMT
jgi:hypothetical protein